MFGEQALVPPGSSEYILFFHRLGMICVARAVLQTPLSLINSVVHPFVKISSIHCLKF